MVNVIDYVPGNSLLHRANPVAKLILAVALIVATFLADTYVLLGILIVFCFTMAAISGVALPLARLLKLLVPLACVMLLLQTAFLRTGAQVFAWMTVDGLVSGSKTALRLGGAFLPLMLVLMVTKLTDLANASVEILHLPYRYAFTFTTALRFVPIFGQEMAAIMEAQTARGVEYDTKNPVKKLKLMLPLCVPLLVSSVAKTDATALAAEQRGFYLRSRESSYKRYPFSAVDVAGLILSIVLIVLGILF